MRSSAPVVLLILGFLCATVPLGAEPRHIAVTGEAEVRLDPDLALVTLGVESWAPDLDAARQDNEGRVARVLAVPGRFGVVAADVKTDFLSIEPQYERDERGSLRSIAGYRVTQVLTVQVRSLSSVGALVSAALAAGANRLDTVAFVVADPGSRREEVRLAAVRNARTKAAALAAELGQGLGRPLSVSETGPGALDSPRYKLFSASAFTEGAGATPLAAGQVVLSAQVAVEFELVDPQP